MSRCAVRSQRAGSMDRTRTKKAGPDSLYEKSLPIKGKAEVRENKYDIIMPYGEVDLSL